MKQKNNWYIHLVPHTHWDKEWYFTKQDSDILLFDNINKLLEMLDNNEINNFTYDGQVSVIDDYLKYDKTNIDKIKKYIKEKKVIIGPWYTQPDLFNITSESIIRNLLYGINFCKKFEANHLNIAYVPDSFGHNNQMPQIYNLFGLNNFLYWRGISKGILDKQGVLSFWKGINGDKILSYNMQYGYWPFGANFPYNSINESNIDESAKRFLNNTKEMLESIKEKSKKCTNHILVPLGGDQAPIIRHLKGFTEKLNEFSEDNWILSDYEKFFDDLKNNISKVDAFDEELRYPFLSRIHRTIGSQRQDIKSKMKSLETELYYNLEPLMTFYYLSTGIYNKQFLDDIIKNLLVSQAHDSIGGCNSDRTNSDVKNRIDRCFDLVESLKTKVLKNIASKINIKEEEFIIFNPELTEEITNKQIKIFSKYKDIDILDEENKVINFSILKSEYHNSGMIVKPSANGEKVEKANGFYEHNIFLQNVKLKEFSYKKFSLIEKTKKNKESLLNENFDIKIEHEKIIIKSKSNKKIIEVFLEAERDLGDSYDFSPEADKTILINNFLRSRFSKKNIDNLQIYKVDLYYLVPNSETSEAETEQKVSIILKVFESNKLHLSLNMVNKAKDIRWRLSLRSKDKSSYTINDQCYSVINREHNKYFDNWKKDGWKEAPVNIEPFESFCGSENGVFVYTKDLNEYELKNDTDLVLTLFRSVSSLGRNNLLWRPGRSSGTSEFNIETIDSRLINYFLNVNLLINFNLNDNHSIKSKTYIKDCLYYQKQNFNNLYKKFDRFLTNEVIFNTKKIKTIKVNNSSFVIKTIKKEENGDNIIVRGFNPTDKEIDLMIACENKNIIFDLVNLKEEVILKKLSSIKIKKNQIVSIKINGDVIYDK
ncbi:glycosyl hydrolase-related protein [Spiroplasma tabanidicola]|uniref:Alpha-mannosidase n=1 Tax=Spiroplasma tabanidicola TaxID=324079 RepID=A0A6I6CD93_9MOLU|nr:glycosyl hydrolase-related protein [Spiroplasma tabanidicola]QGS52278.1 Alpha-mannosidase [Spiroplasma tabanidicola]